MRILILLSTLLASAIQPNGSVEKEANVEDITVTSIAATKANAAESIQNLDIDTEYLMKGSW